MTNLSELEQRKRELELKRDIRRLERGAAVNDAVGRAKEKSAGVGRLVLKWVGGAFLLLVTVVVVAVVIDSPIRG